MFFTVLLTADGSHTLATSTGVIYHSHHGAIAESRHIFIEAGLKEAACIFPTTELSILEIGFGTGLNAFLTALEANASQRRIRYHTTELHPIPEPVAATLNYPDLLGHREIFAALHTSPWDEATEISPHFTLHKHLLDATQALPPGPFHCIYFDAFGPEVQPALWTEAMFARIREAMHPGAILTTYCSKSAVRRAMQAAGLVVEKLPGPYGKRDIVRARRAG